MPLYSNPTTTALTPGDLPALAFSAERPAAGALSKSFAVTPQPGLGVTTIAMALSWPSDPGAFKYTLCTADVDLADNYFKEAGGSLSSAQGPGPTGGFGARLELNIKAKFVAILCETQTANVVNTAANLTI